MIDITGKIFETALIGFYKSGEEILGEKKLDFYSIIERIERYKYDILEEAKSQLLTNTWRETDLGTGRISNYVSKAINIYINNLIDWRKKDDFKKLKENSGNEKLLFDFFKSKIEDEYAFNKFYKKGFPYQLIAYLFFVKNPQKYMPISQKQFDKIFDSLGINFKTSYNCSWENYIEFNEIIKKFRQELSIKFPKVSLLDAHSFFWIYGFQVPSDKEEIDNQDVISKQESQNKNPIQKPTLKLKPELETYQPKKIIDVDNLTEISNDIDWLENHKELMEIGNLAEKIAFDSEVEFLNENCPELAERVRFVSDNPDIGFDILSFEIDGKQKQIEVKAVSTNNEKKSFIISQNEFQKSKTYSNYYVYCVYDIGLENPRILRLKNPDFDNRDEFKIEPLTYKITFE